MVAKAHFWFGKDEMKGLLKKDVIMEYDKDREMAYFYKKDKKEKYDQAEVDELQYQADCRRQESPCRGN
jgi:hypothetical protein